MAGRGGDGLLEAVFKCLSGSATYMVPNHFSGKFIAAGVCSKVSFYDGQVLQNAPRIPEIQIRVDVEVVSCLAWMAVDNAGHL